MKFVLKPSLEHRALVKIVVSLWNQVDVRKHSSSNWYSWKEWKKAEERVIKKVLQLSLPQLLKEKLLGLVKPIGLQIQDWKRYHHSCCDLLLNLPAELCWTPQGTVDRKKTAEVLVKDESLDMSTRYELVCIYCLEDDIIQFWNNMTEDLKESVLYKSHLVSFWSHRMKRRGIHIDYRSVFEGCVEEGDKVAAEYFLQKLTPQEREESMVEAAKHVRDDADMLCFLISEMHEEQQMEIFKYNPYEVLYSFLQWPWQSFFTKVASCMCDFLSSDDYDEILTEILDKVKDGFKDCNYENLFREFWQKSPSALKDSLIDEIDKSLLVHFLCHIKDKKNIKLIFKDTAIAVKEKLIYSVIMSTFCKRSICDREWDFLEFCIQEFLSSKNEMLKFKEEFEKHKMPSSFKKHFRRNKIKWDKLFPLSDDSICKYNRRNAEKGESSSFKQFCSIQ